MFAFLIKAYKAKSTTIFAIISIIFHRNTTGIRNGKLNLKRIRNSMTIVLQ